MTNGPAENGNSSSGTIEFIDYHRPLLPPDDYEIAISQDVFIRGSQAEPTFSAMARFSVLGPRFELKPEDINSVFPPDGSLGDHSNVLPHIIFNRSTLPWERSADESQENIPWLALLLFDDDV